jgi:AraC family transcriptional regulator
MTGMPLVIFSNFIKKIGSIFSDNFFANMENAQGSISLIKAFPDFSVPGFNVDSYNNFFKTSNSIIHASSSDIAYPKHWGCYSIKFGGEEYYAVGNRVYSVNDNNFLILNEGTFYSSYIYSEKKVESFTLNFTYDFLQEGIYTSKTQDAMILDEPYPVKQISPEFVERLYPHDHSFSPILFRIRELTNHFKTNLVIINELYYRIIEEMFMLNKEVNREMNRVPAAKLSTRKEVYKRLHYAKDYIDSCYNSEIDLQSLSRIALMNGTYFLRQFKKYFRITPHQYIINKRMEVAKELLDKRRLKVFEICQSVGYEDISSFVKLFSRHFGHSPEKYRILYS